MMSGILDWFGPVWQIACDTRSTDTHSAFVSLWAPGVGGYVRKSRWLSSEVRVKVILRDRHTFLSEVALAELVTVFAGASTSRVRHKQVTRPRT